MIFRCHSSGLKRIFPFLAIQHPIPLQPPFRGKVPYVIKTPWLPNGRFWLEVYYYPHGLALVANARCKGTFTLKDATELAFKVRLDEQYEVELEGTALGKYKLDELATMALKLLSEKAWGKGATDSSLNDPFTIFTVIQGEGVDPKPSIVDPKVPI